MLRVTPTARKTRFQPLVRRYRTGFSPAGFQRKVSESYPYISSSSPKLCLAQSLSSTQPFFRTRQKTTLFLTQLARPKIRMSFSESGCSDGWGQNCLSARPIKGTYFGTVGQQSKALRTRPPERGWLNGKMEDVIHSSTRPEYTEAARESDRFCGGVPRRNGNKRD